MIRAWILSLVLVPSVSAGTLSVGSAKVDITPERFPVVVNGMFTERSANGALDRLQVRALVIENGETRVVIAVVDSCMMPREFLDKTKELASRSTGIPVDKMLISATHTHSAPAVMGCLGSDADPIYPTFLQTQIVRAITMANKARTPAKAGAVAVSAPNHTFNRRWILRSDKVRNDPFGNPTVRANMHPGYQNPDFVGPSGPVDDALTLLAFRSLDDKPLAVLANYSMHYFGSGICSSDYFGAFCDKLGKKLGCDVTMSQGTSGDLMWMDYGKPKSNMTMERYAQELAELAAGAQEKIEFKPDLPLQMAEATLTLGRRIPDAKRLAWARPILEGLKGKKVQSQQEIYAREAVMLHAEPQRELKLQALRLGDFAICAIPNEVFALTGLKLKRASPLKTTCVIELANGADGYIPPAEQHDLGGYTTWPARTAGLEVHAETKISLTLFKLLSDVAGQPVKPLDEATVAVGGELRPLAWWKFDEMGGPRAIDALGKHHGTYEPRIARFMPGKMSQAVQFVGGRMTAPAAGLGPNYSVSLSFWNGFPIDARPITGYLFSRAIDGDTQARGDNLGIGGTKNHPGRLLFFNGHGHDQVLAGKTDLQRQKWYHIVLVREGSKVTVYLDGKEEFSGEAASSIPAQEHALFFGGRCDRFAGLEGRIDDARIWDRSLTAQEAARLYAEWRP